MIQSYNRKPGVATCAVCSNLPRCGGTELVIISYYTRSTDMKMNIRTPRPLSERENVPHIGQMFD